ncbi:hypothetical protein RCL_jg6518.t1 [Rhizophagus clarus]|uniref:Uncharacterized protein n=1 Tax=Rhizophagus clarus TaxID=94130 RepID=A0A8H3QMS7_9GLOM|nr:hypothetical protein RCL_jg6518.t1 [Rhizophagus clarus]
MSIKNFDNQTLPNMFYLGAFLVIKRRHVLLFAFENSLEKKKRFDTANKKQVMCIMLRNSGLFWGDAYYIIYNYF